MKKQIYYGYDPFLAQKYESTWKILGGDGEACCVSPQSIANEDDG